MPIFLWTKPKPVETFKHALVQLNAALPPDKAITTEAALGSKQSTLSEKLDGARWAHQLHHASIIEQAVLRSESSVGARAFLSALPHGHGRMEPAAFISELRVRLGVPDSDADAWCPRCDGILDRQSHHAGTCVAGGERTQRHHAIRNLVFEWASQAGLRPEKEAPHLLLPQSPDDTSTPQRRPADLFIPALAGSPAALDFAVTATTRQETLASASQIEGAAAAAYAHHKETYLATAQTCERQGILFLPMVVETTGNWDARAYKVLRHIAQGVASRTGTDHATTLSTLLQEAKVVVRGFRARAALRRRAELASQ